MLESAENGNKEATVKESKALESLKILTGTFYSLPTKETTHSPPCFDNLGQFFFQFCQCYDLAPEY